MMKPQVWHTLVVRLWRDGEGLKLRFLTSQTGQQPANLPIATSFEAATREFELWLRSIEPDNEDVTPAPPPTTPMPHTVKRENDAGTTGADTSPS